MSELPSGWARITLEAIADWGSGCTPSRSESSFYGGKIPWIKSGELNSRYITTTEEYITEAAIKASSAKIFPAGSVAIAMYGATIGKTAILGVDASTNQACAVGIPIEGLIGKVYLYRVLQNEKQAFVEKGKGGAQPNISQAVIKAHEIGLPPLAEQNRIAAKLDELLAQVDTLKARIDSIPALVKRFRQSVLAAAVSGRLTEEWRSKNLGPRETGIQLMAETADRKRDWSESNNSHNEVARVKKRLSEFAKKKFEQNDLPASWCWAELEDVSLLIVDCHNKTAPYEKDGIPLIRTSNIRDGNFQWKDLRYVNEETYKFWSRRCVPEPGDIVFTREAPMGEAAIIPEGKIICLGQRTMLIRCIEECTSAEFILLALRDPKFKARSEKLAVGTGVKHYRVGDVSDLLIPVPTKAEQTEIVRRVEQLFIFADQLEARVKAAQTRINRLTQSILAKAFRGELVPQDPNDEPASVLVDRIKAQRAPKAKRSRQAATLG